MPTPPYQIQAAFTLRDQIEARAEHAEVSSRVALRHDDRTFTYRQYRDECVRTAHWLQRRLGARTTSGPSHVAMILENQLELLSLYGGCAYSGATLFGVNTGLTGEPLAGVLNQSRARILVVDERFASRVEAVAGQLDHLSRDDILVLEGDGADRSGDSRDFGGFRLALEREVGAVGESLPAPDAEVTPDTNLMVIYTSGTTGLPKGINNNHFKLLVIGATVAGRMELGADECGYACMPLFHSNAMFLGFHPAFHVGGCLALRERFSASAFVPDVLRYGATYWNYVGEPVHYILGAIEREYGSDEAKIRSAVTEHPDNRLRYALGNGASPPDIDRLARWLGLEDVFELYGSTEAAISTFRRIADPRGSVGEITDEAVQILDADGNECPPARQGADGKIANYAEAVGEICRVAGDTALFQGYYENADADRTKYQGGVYHSGDLGHVLIVDERRFLFFDGRTDDWIRKDGENFSAAQVARLVGEFPGVVLAAAYGVPCVVSDEWVMVALKLAEGAELDPGRFFAWCEEQIRHGGMDRKWMPDFVRVVSDFEYTQTQKILVRNLKRQHFDPRRLEGEPIYWRRRGDESFLPFSGDDFQTLHAEFERAERADLLDR